MLTPAARTRSMTWSTRGWSCGLVEHGEHGDARGRDAQPGVAQAVCQRLDRHSGGPYRFQFWNDSRLSGPTSGRSA